MDFSFDGLNFEFSSADCLQVQMCVSDAEERLKTYKITFDWEAPVSPQPVTLVFYHKPVDMYSHMKPDLYRVHNVPWGAAKAFESRIASWMPIVQFVSKTEQNRLLITLGDVKSHIRINSFIDLPGFALKTEITFFVSLTNPISHYETLLRVDERDVKYTDALADVSAWYASLGYQNNHVPESAFDSVYSTWYAYLQEVTAKDIIKEARLAKKAGMDTLILDDGWQNEGLVRDYSGCGDWKPAKNRFQSMRKFVDELHKIDMKVMLWFSVPFIGYDAENFKRFETMFLKKLDNMRCAVLDPRYKVVREFLVDTYARAVRDWDLDGLKLDFIDRFASNGEVNANMDFASVEDAVEQLLKEIQSGLRAVKKDILIEFRQPYMGPVISTYGNMMRVWDCPLDPITNRVGITELRLLTGGCAVHSDMIVWDNADSAESVATHLYSSIFSVPQISVRMAEITDEHNKVLKSYLAFREKHRKTLMHGSFLPQGIHANYSRTEAVLGQERVSLFNDIAVLELNGNIADDYVINLSGSDKVFIDGDKQGVFYKITDCTGKCIGRRKKLNKTCSFVQVPNAGIVHFIRETKEDSYAI